jgi:cellulose synthase/poly-beta-1,6-N-acetylglucosamine synthase-like glycosyltransferase
MTFLEITFWILASLVLYVYAGYPLLLWALRAVLGVRPVACGTSEPAVTLIISAFNEVDVIRLKLQNSLALEYPADKLEIVVVSDASDDGTDEAVQRCDDARVRLLRMPERGGKTVGLNAAAQMARGEILIFSDANAMYCADAVRSLVRNFDDPEVGAAVGESSYIDSANSAEKSESAYWRYETAIKRLETQLGSVVGGDGAIYAVRKECYRPMAADALSDFVNPLQVVEQGRRCVYEPDALSVEEAAGSFDREFRRKVRIVNRAWRAMMSMKSMLNPFRYGLFAWALVSHKVLRWLVPMFLVVMVAINLALLGQHPVYTVTLIGQLLFYGLGAVGALARRQSNLSLPLYIPFYFCLVNIASLRGIIESYRGKTYATWSPARVDRPHN